MRKGDHTHANTYTNIQGDRHRNVGKTEKGKTQGNFRNLGASSRMS